MAWTRTGTDSSLNLGLQGSQVIADTTPVIKNFCRIYALTTAVVTLEGDPMTGFTSITLPAGQDIRGPITKVTLTSGSVIAYNS